ncbi:MAG: hypothetical protein IPJ82_24935 [Lewinellaceae bacterium]|nr:hypothetical protein [Lewinellaceae bacterium]
MCPGLIHAWLLSSSAGRGYFEGVFPKSLGSGGLRKGLVVFQFTASIALITATWLVSRQISFEPARPRRGY